MKKGTCKRFMAMAMSLVTALGTGFGGGVNMVYAANSFKAGDTVQIKYLHNNKTYKKSAVDARWNDKILGTKMPGYIDEDSNAMYSAYWIFGQAEGPKVLYKKSGDTFTLSRYNTTIKMTVDSKTAYINGKKTTMSTAPRKVYNYGNKTNYIMVPGSWTAKNLGISYKWNATKRAGCMRAASQSGGSNNATTATTKPTTTAVKPTTTTAKYTVTGTLPNARVKASKSNYNLRIKLPSGVTSYYLEDKYTSRQLFMSCAGNYVSHFNNASNRYAKSSMSGFTVKYNSTKKRTYVYVKASSSYRGYAVSFDNGYAYIKWGTPKTMYKNILVLDAGHGGSDSGATGNRLREKDLTLSIVLAAKKQFDKDKNYAVYYTRTTDTYPSLTDRSDLANNVGADYFLSCHINSAGATAKGSETLYNSQGYKASNGVTSYKWAANVHNFTKAATGFTNRGLVDRTGLAVLRHTKTASTLTEFGFISNKSEAASMKTNTDKYGKAMYDSVVKMFKTNPSKR